MKNWIAHGSVVIVRSQYLSASCKHARLPSKMAGHFCNFIKSSFNNFFVWETQSTKPDFYARNFIIPHSDFHSHMIKSTKTLYKWIFKHDCFVLGTRFTMLEDLPRCVLRHLCSFKCLSSQGLYKYHKYCTLLLTVLLNVVGWAFWSTGLSN